ncbi:hypothetical protein bcgnr5380_63620 [Bacillus cereus]
MRQAAIEPRLPSRFPIPSSRSYFLSSFTSVNSASTKSDDVVDAEFTEVKDDKK